AFWRSYHTEPLFTCTTEAAKWINSTGIHNKNIQSISGLFYGAHHVIHVHALVVKVCFYLTISTGWYEVVHTFYLHAVTRVKNQTDSMRFSLQQLKVPQDTVQHHTFIHGIINFHHSKSFFLQR